MRLVVLKGCWNFPDDRQHQQSDGGYDLVLEARGIVRHVQLKSSYSGAFTKSVKVSLGLEGKPSGCVIWVLFDSETMKLGPFFYFGGSPGSPIPKLTDLRIAKHTKGTSEGVKNQRPNNRVLRKSQFKKLESVDDLVKHLFGNPI